MWHIVISDAIDGIIGITGIPHICHRYRHWTFPDEHESAISSTGVSYMMGRRLNKRDKSGKKPVRRLC
eukprot:COSAG05_NODE_716_length_7804_cov_2.669825_12_plen_68_part_00